MGHLMGLVDFEFACGFCAVDRGGFLVDSGGGLRCGGSGWVTGWRVCEVVLGGGGGFWSIRW